VDQAAHDDGIVRPYLEDGELVSARLKGLPVSVFRSTEATCRITRWHVRESLTTSRRHGVDLREEPLADRLLIVVQEVSGDRLQNGVRARERDTGHSARWQYPEETDASTRIARLIGLSLRTVGVAVELRHWVARLMVRVQPMHVVFIHDVPGHERGSSTTAPAVGMDERAALGWNGKGRYVPLPFGPPRGKRAAGMLPPRETHHRGTLDHGA